MKKQKCKNSLPLQHVYVNVNDDVNVNMGADLTELNEWYQQSRNYMPGVEKFFLIKDAVKVSEKNHNLPIYSLDKQKSNLKGAKIFYTGSYDAFWSFYSKLSVDDRCFYETLLPDQPCHLYADIEGCKETNLDVDFEKVYIQLQSELQCFTRDFLKLNNKYQFRLIDPDSSTNKKFSKHCLLKIEETIETVKTVESGGCIFKIVYQGYFRNNYHCGALMRQFQKYILEKFGHPQKGKNPFYIWSDKETDFQDQSKKVFLIDLGVYTLRRQFRLLGSSKRVNPRRPLYLNPMDTTITKRDFFDCLIQYISDPKLVKQVFTVVETNGAEPISCSLRTFDLSGNTVSIQTGSHVTGSQVNLLPRIPIAKQTTLRQPLPIEDYVRPKNPRSSVPISVQNALTNYFKIIYGYDITAYRLGGDKIKLETNDRRCMYKKSTTGINEHKSNHVYFVVYPENKFHFQGCYDQDSCMKNGKPCITTLGENGIITDLKLCEELNDWWFPKTCDWSVI